MQTLSCLPEKFVVDLANGIDVVRDHVRTQQSQTIFSRLWSDLTGSNARRQQSVNASLADGVESSLLWLTELTDSLASSNLAIAQVNDRVNKLSQNSAQIAHFSVDTRQQLVAFQQKMNARVFDIEQKLAQIDLIQQGRIQLEQEITRWKAGRYHQLSLAGRAYAVLESLRWGAFGDLLRHGDTKQSSRLFEELHDKVVIQLADDQGIKSLDRQDTSLWLQNSKSQMGDALAYMGDWSLPDLHPIVFSVTQTEKKIPLGMPSRCSAERLAGTMAEEIFGER